jgi:hypothetical protein
MPPRRRLRRGAIQRTSGLPPACSGEGASLRVHSIWLTIFARRFEPATIENADQKRRQTSVTKSALSI